MALESPLTEQDYEGIKTQLETLSALDEQLRLATQAGVDVTSQKEEARKSREQLTRLKQTYFPNKP